MKKEIIERISRFDFSRDFVTDAAKDRHYTYQEFFGRCLSLADEFRKSGKNNHHIVFIMENSVELLACYFAAIFSGKIATAIDPVKEQDEISRILASIPDKYVIVDASGKAKVESYEKLFEAGSFETIV